MSYVRFAEDGSDVYVIETVECLECVFCSLQEYEKVEDPSNVPFGFRLRPVGVQNRFTTTAGMLEHLAAHRAAGHTVPESAFAELRADQDRLDAELAQ